MTNTAISALPAAAGSAILSTMWRGFVWTLVRVFRAPVASALLIAMTLGIAYAATNALYMQSEHHPAPLFGEDAITTSSVDTAVRSHAEPTPARPAVAPHPALRPRPMAAAPRIVTEPIVSPAPNGAISANEITNADIKAMQEKLRQLNFYDGKTDGFYGPQTAQAIRAFELSHGMDPVGAVTPEVLGKIDSAPLPGAEAALAPRQSTDVGTVKPTALEAPGSPQENVANAIPPNPIPAPNTQAAPVASGTDRLMDIVTRVATAARDTVEPPRTTSHTEMVKKIQRGLASLGFLRGKVDGVAGADTARAIRKFENYYDYRQTGKASPELVDLLIEKGAKV